MAADSVARSFSRAAACYRQTAMLHRAIAAKLAEFLPSPLVEHVFEAGCGTGFLTEHLVRCFPNAEIDAVDISAGMLTEAQKTLCAARVQWHQGDARAFRGRGCYDLIATCSALQWMRPYDRLFSHFAALLPQGGRLTAAVMISGTLGELRTLRELLIPGKRLQNGLPSPDELHTALIAAGFQIERSAEEEYVEVYPSAAQFMRSIKELGFTGGSLSSAPAPLGRHELARLLERYTEHYAAPGGVRGTFRILYLDARCSALR